LEQLNDIMDLQASGWKLAAWNVRSNL